MDGQADPSECDALSESGDVNISAIIPLSIRKQWKMKRIEFD